MNKEKMKAALNRVLDGPEGDRIPDGYVGLCYLLGSCNGCDSFLPDTDEYKWCREMLYKFQDIFPDEHYRGCYVSTPTVMTPRRRMLAKWLLEQLEEGGVQE